MSLACLRLICRHWEPVRGENLHMEYISDERLRLYFCSQYHVAPSAIIHRPRNLLEWCSRLGITYSFSPNFLIAQLCRDVAASPYASGTLNLSSLAAFISGGEAIPIKTAIEFADIIENFGAPRNALRAGFGMSETGVRPGYLLKLVAY